MSLVTLRTGILSLSVFLLSTFFLDCQAADVLCDVVFQTSGTDEERLPQAEISSDKGHHVLVLVQENIRDMARTGGENRYKPGHCKAELFKKEQGGRTLVWERYLVNNLHPMAVAVADSGKYVVTFGDGDDYGALAMVVYDERGGLILVENMGPLVPEEESQGLILETSQGPNWLDDVKALFGEQDETFFLFFSDKDFSIIDLHAAHVLRDPREEHASTPAFLKRLLRDDYSSFEEEWKRWKKLREFAKKRAKEMSVSKQEEPADRARLKECSRQLRRSTNASKRQGEGAAAAKQPVTKPPVDAAAHDAVTKPPAGESGAPAEKIRHGRRH